MKSKGDGTAGTVNWGVFIDRDGTVTEEVGYVNHPFRLRLISGAAEAVARLNRAGVPAILATNQAGVARGYFTEEVLLEVRARLVEMLADLGARFDLLLHCPHHPDVGAPPYRKNCDCRKPKPGMLLEGSKRLGLDPARCYVVGDKISDVAFARSCGARGVMVLTGYGLGEYEYDRKKWTIEPDHVADDLAAAVNWILDREGLS